jgi:hypothetical protein
MKKEDKEGGTMDGKMRKKNVMEKIKEINK